MTHNRLKKCTSQVPFKNNQNSYTCSNSKLSFRFKALSYEFDNHIVYAIEKHLNFTDVFVLNKMIEMQRQHMTLYMSQEWLASLCGKTREWVNKRIAKLTRLGLIAKINRGIKQTCLYRVHDLFFRKHICKLIAKFLPDWFRCYQSYVSKKFTQENIKGCFNNILSNLSNTIFLIGKNSHKCGKWVAGVFFPQRFKRSNYHVKPKTREELYKKGRYQSPNSLQRMPIRQDKCERIIVLVEEKHVETYAASQARKKVSYLDGFFEICKANALKQQTPQLRATPLNE